MNRNLYLYICILLAGLGIASCGSRKDEKERTEASESLMSPAADRSKQEFSDTPLALEILCADTLSKAEQDAMCKLASQKQDDYYNYQEIINNPQYDTALRNHARLLAQAMLLNKESVQPKHNPGSIDNQGVVSGTYTVPVTDANGCSATSLGLAYSEKDSTYTGILPGTDKHTGLVSAGSPSGFVVKKVSKRFGNKLVRVWEVFLK